MGFQPQWNYTYLPAGSLLNFRQLTTEESNYESSSLCISDSNGNRHPVHSSLNIARACRKPATSNKTRSKDLWFTDSPGMDDANIKRDITYKTVNGAALKLDAYYPAGMKDDARLPVVIFVNGVGDPPQIAKVKEWGQYTCWPKLIAASGFIAISYEARPADPDTDSRELIEYVRKNAASLKVDENNICLWSCSANVRVALPLVMQAERKYIRCAVVYYGAAAVPSMRNDVPIFFARAGRDMPQLNAGIDNFVRAALSEDVPLTVVNYVNGRHAFDLMDDTDESREVIKQTTQLHQVSPFPKRCVLRRRRAL